MNAFAEIVSADTVRIERQLDAPVDTVWRFLVDPDKRAKWFAEGEIEPRPGGRLVCVFDHDKLSPEPGAVPEEYKNAIGHRSELTVIEPRSRSRSSGRIVSMPGVA